MRKTEKRKRIARVFAKYERLGLDDRRLSVFDVCRRIRGSQRKLSDANDLFAAWATCRALREGGEPTDLELFLAVYRVGGRSATSIALREYYDERTLYRRLEKVERQYERIRKSLETKK